MKYGLVVEGGGMKCAYSAGILDRFLDDGISFDECVGVSAGAGNIASYLAGQRGRNIRFYTSHITEPEYAGVVNFLKKGSFFDLQYVYGTLSVSTGPDPFYYYYARENPAEFYLGATDAQSGQMRYFSKYDMQPNDYRPIMASCAIPALCRPIEIDGRFYFDGGVADSIPLKKAFEDGCDKVVVLLANPRSFIRPPQDHKAGYHLLLRRYPNIARLIDTRHLTYRETLSYVYRMEAAGSVFVFAPPENSGVTTSSSDPAKMQALYERGIADYDTKRQKLYEFLRRGECE